MKEFWKKFFKPFGTAYWIGVVCGVGCAIIVYNHPNKLDALGWISAVMFLSTTHMWQQMSDRWQGLCDSLMDQYVRKPTDKA